MRKKIGRIGKLLLVSILVLVYCTVLVRAINESARRSLRLRDDTDAADHVEISVLVTAVNPSSHELTAQISLRPQGNIAKDEVTPAVDLNLLTNNVKSPQEFSFPKGKRMNRIEVVFPLNGEVNQYPFDHYGTTLWVLMTTPARKKPPQTSNIPESAEDQALQLALGTTALQESTVVPLTINLSASTPGIKFEGSVSRGSARKLLGVELKLRRADSVISVSILLMVLMGALAMSLLAMVLKATSGPQVNLVPLSICISLIFGLPALRNVQPGVPPVGALGDYFSFIWAEIIVGASALIIVWTWLLRSDEEP